MTIEEDLPPDPELIESMRAMGYTSQTAVADILDNSIAAQASLIEIFGDAGQEPYLCIADDGFGMSKDELRTAMKYAGKNVGTVRGKKDLGRFGLGLKTASLSQARRLVVISKRKDQEIVGAAWDVDHVITTGKWSLIWLDADEIAKYQKKIDFKMSSKGTLVIWQSLDSFLSAAKNPELAISKKLEDIGLHLSLVFHRYLSGELGNKLTIRVNNKDLEPTDPFFRSNQSTQAKEEKIRVGRTHVDVNAFIIPTARMLTSQDQMVSKQLEKLGKDLQGFYVYRQFRLIVWGTWYRIAPRNELSKFARIMVDTPTSLDKDWDLDVTKSKGVPPLGLRQNLSRLVPSIIRESQRVSGKKTSHKPDPEGRYWSVRSKSEHSFSIEINRENKAVVRLSESLNETQNRLLSLLFDSLEKGFPAMEFNSRINGNERFGELYSAEDAIKIALETYENLKQYFTPEVAFDTLLSVEPNCSDPRLTDLLMARKNEIIKG